MSGRFGRWLCDHGYHRWGIYTRPIMVRWCERCGEREQHPSAVLRQAMQDWADAVNRYRP